MSHLNRRQFLGRSLAAGRRRGGVRDRRDQVVGPGPRRQRHASASASPASTAAAARTSTSSPR